MNEQIIPGSKMMKVTGILMIISGALSIISSLVVKAATTLMLLLSAAYEPGGDLEKASGRINSAYTIFILLGIVVLAVGIIATVQAKKPVNPIAVIVLCALVVILAIVANIVLGTGVSAATAAGVEGLNPVTSILISIISSAVLPILCIVGSLKKKKALNL